MKNNFFTLIELIVVIVVLSILAVIIIPNISDLREHSTIVSLDSDSRNIETAVDMYVLDNNEEYLTEDKTGVLAEEKRTIKELTKKLKVLNKEGEMIEVDTEVVLVSELVGKGHLKNEPKNKKAKFYLVEGGDVIWHLEGVTNSNIIENNDDVISDKELNLTKLPEVSFLKNLRF